MKEWVAHILSQGKSRNSKKRVKREVTSFSRIKITQINDANQENEKIRRYLFKLMRLLNYEKIEFYDQKKKILITFSSVDSSTDLTTITDNKLLDSLLVSNEQIMLACFSLFFLNECNEKFQIFGHLSDYSIKLQQKNHNSRKKEIICNVVKTTSICPKKPNDKVLQEIIIKEVIDFLNETIKILSSVCDDWNVFICGQESSHVVQCIQKMNIKLENYLKDIENCPHFQVFGSNTPTLTSREDYPTLIPSTQTQERSSNTTELFESNDSGFSKTDAIQTQQPTDCFGDGNSEELLGRQKISCGGGPVMSSSSMSSVVGGHTIGIISSEDNEKSTFDNCDNDNKSSLLSCIVKFFVKIYNYIANFIAKSIAYFTRRINDNNEAPIKKTNDPSATIKEPLINFMQEEVQGQEMQI